MWFKRFKPKVEYRVIEYNSPRLKSNLNGVELTESLRALGNHPAFTFLLDRLRSQSLALEGHLKRERHKDLREADFLQSGIYWSNWLEREIKKLTAIPTPKATIPETSILTAFNEIDSTLDRVGIEALPQTAE